ncbi:hypothetical protein ACFL1M_04775, partial [Patescibacteria group bacterium]
SKISGEVVVFEAELFFDLSLVKEEVFGELMAYGDGWITVLDRSRGLVVGIEAETKQAKILGGGELLSGASLLAGSVQKSTILSNKGIVALFYGDREAEVLVETEDIWESPIVLGMFGGNVYLVDSQTSEVWQYPGLDGGVGSRRRWLGPGVFPDFSGASDISIDGDVWITTKEGTIYLYRRGAPISFDIEGLVDPLGDIWAISAPEDHGSVYVLDRHGSRVVVSGKDGVYKRQYIWKGISSVTDMLVVEDGEEHMILLLSGSSIYKIPIVE